MNFKRWYDVDATMSRAIALWEKADENIQTICADYVIDKLKDLDFEMSLDEQYNSLCEDGTTKISEFLTQWNI